MAKTGNLMGARAANGRIAHRRPDLDSAGRGSLDPGGQTFLSVLDLVEWNRSGRQECLPPVVLPTPVVRHANVNRSITGALLVVLGCGMAPLTLPAQEIAPPAEKLTVVAQARPTTCFVGQTVELSVGVVAGRERPQVTAPRLEGAEVFLARTEQVPLSTSGIGDMIREQNLFRFRYRIVPRRAGMLTIPRVSARLGERTGSSDPVRLTVREVPQVGRPAAFLGGVGTFEVSATAVPESVRTGQSLEYRVTIKGPGARGVTTAPGLERLASLPLGLRVEQLPDVTMPDPPSHTFVFRLRPTRTGEATLPPVAVAGFDPVSGQFSTKVSAGIRVRVSEVPPFDTARLSYGPPPASGIKSGMNRRAWHVAGVITTIAVTGAAGAAVTIRLRRDNRRALRRLARRLATRLDRSSSESERARAITEALAEYLRITTGRPLGALTPAEASESVARATGRDDLAWRAREVIARCDRVWFGHASEPAADSLREEGCLIIDDLAGAFVPRSREGDG